MVWTLLLNIYVLLYFEDNFEYLKNWTLSAW